MITPDPVTIRVLALMEASTVTGPAKNLLRFAELARLPGGDLPAVHVTVASYVRKSSPRLFLEAARQAGLPVAEIPERRRWDVGVLRVLRALAAQIRPDVIQTHNIKSHLLVRLSGLWRDTPWVAFHHGYTDRDLLDRIYKHFDRFSLRVPDRVVTVCGPFAESMRCYGVAADRIVVQHNSVTPFVPPARETVESVRSRFGLPPGVPLILSVGRLSKEKGHAELIRAVSILRRQSPALEFRVALVGEGPEGNALRERVLASRLEGMVVFCGQQADVAPFYAAASLVVLPSWSEGSPNVLLEAMAAALPVVATSVGGVPEIVSGGAPARLCPPGDVQDLASHIEALLRDPASARTMGAAACQAILSRYTPEAQRRAIIEVYQEAIAARPAPAPLP